MLDKILYRFKRLLAVYILIGILIALLKSVNVYFFQKLLDSYNNFDWMIIFLYAVTLIIVPVLSYIDELPKTRLYHGIYFFIKKCSLEKVSRIDYLEYTKINSGKLLQQIEIGALAGRDIYMNFYSKVFRELIPEALFNLFFITLINAKLIIPIIIGYIIIFLLTKLLLHMLQALKESSLISSEKMNHIFVRGINEMVTFRINKRYKKEIEQYEELSKQTTNSLTKMTMTHELFFGVFALLVSIVKVIVVLLFLLGYVDITLGSIVALLIYIDRIYSPIAIFNVIFVQFNLDKITFNRLKTFLKLKDDLNLFEGKNVAHINNITFDDVKIKIEDKQILNKFNYHFEKNNIYAIIGSSGTGKSTLIKIILGLLKQKNENIHINEDNLSSLKLDSLYDNMFYISQESQIFQGSLRENIIFDQQKHDEEIIKVLGKCQLDKFYSELPNGLDTQIGNMNISGGEKQRIAFARMFFSNAEIIILDEATSALDEVTENQIFKEILKEFNDKIVIMITHRLNNLIFADKVLNLNEFKDKVE